MLWESLWQSVTVFDKAVNKQTETKCSISNINIHKINSNILLESPPRQCVVWWWWKKYFPDEIFTTSSTRSFGWKQRNMVPKWQMFAPYERFRLRVWHISRSKLLHAVCIGAVGIILTIQNLKSFNASFFISHKAKKKHTIQLIRIGKSNQNWLPNKFQSHALQIKNNLPDSQWSSPPPSSSSSSSTSEQAVLCRFRSDYGEEKCNSYCCIICKLTRNGTERKQMWHWHAMAICLLWV